MVIATSAAKIQPGPPDPRRRKLLVRYKTQTEAKASDISTKSRGDLAEHLKRMFRRGHHSFFHANEYHISLLARGNQPNENSLRGVYKTDELKASDGTTIIQELAQIQPGWEFDGNKWLLWLARLQDALHETRLFAIRELKARRLELDQDYDAYFTGNKGFRLMLRGLTPSAPAKLLCGAMQLFAEERKDLYPALDTGIYNPSLNAGFVRGPGSKHPETRLWSVFITHEELFELPLEQAIEQILQRANMTDRQALKMRRGLDPYAFLGLREEPGPALQAFLEELHHETFELGWIEKSRPQQQSLRELNLQALVESQGLELRSYLYEQEVALLKECPECGKRGKSWLTRWGSLHCFRDRCRASHSHDGLKLHEWAPDCRYEEVIELKTPSGSIPQLVEHPEIETALLDMRDRFIEGKITHALLNRCSPGCKKTTIALDGLQEVMVEGKISGYSAPTHELCQEKIIDLQREARNKGIEQRFILWRGRNVKDELGPMCGQPQRVAEAEAHHLSIRQAACEGCPLFSGCRYMRQHGELAALKQAHKEEGQGFMVVSTHHGLWSLTKVEGLLELDCCVVDEDPSGACVRESRFTVYELKAPYEEPEGMVCGVQAAHQPVSLLLEQTIKELKRILQKRYDRERRKALEKGSNWMPQAEQRVSQELLLEMLLHLNPNAPELIANALQKLEEAHEELLERSEEERRFWVTMLSSALRSKPLLKALNRLLPRSLPANEGGLFTQEPEEESNTQGFSVELSFALDGQKSRSKGNKNQEQKEQERQARRKLIGGTFHIVEAQALAYKGPVMGLDATGETLPWQAMLGQPLETLRQDAPLHPDSQVDWYELGTYQSVLMRAGNEWLERYLVPQVRHHYEQGERILVLTWMKNGPEGSYKDRVIEALEKEGLKVDGEQLDVAHFFAKRGHNRWRAWDMAILWGMPVENPDALRMKCEALSQLVPEEQRQELKEQLLYQCTAGEALQGLHRVGAIQAAKHWSIYASSSYLPLADYLKQIAAPGKFRKLAGRSAEALDPSRLERLEELAQKIASMKFSTTRAVAGLMGLDPVARRILIQDGYIEPGESPLGVLPQGLDHISIREGGSQVADHKYYRDVIETYSAKGLKALLGRREEQRISRRVVELTGWSNENVSRVILQDDDGTVRPYVVHGDEGLGRKFLEQCSALEGHVDSLAPKVSFDTEAAQEARKELLGRCKEAVEGLLVSWGPEDEAPSEPFEWSEEAMIWAYWVVWQWQEEQLYIGKEEAGGEEPQLQRGPP